MPMFSVPKLSIRTDAGQSWSGKIELTIFSIENDIIKLVFRDKNDAAKNVGKIFNQ